MVFEKAEAIEDRGSTKIVKTGSGQYEGKAVILATGRRTGPLWDWLMKRLPGRAFPTAPPATALFGGDVAVVGRQPPGGRGAFSGEVSDPQAGHPASRGDAAGVKRLETKDNVEFILDTVPVAFLGGENTISGLKIRNVKSGEERQLEVSGVFAAVGQMPDNQAFSNVAELDKGGYIAADESCTTARAGIFTAGDCRTKKIRQLATAAADGAVAALAAIEYINSMQA